MKSATHLCPLCNKEGTAFVEIPGYRERSQYKCYACSSCGSSFVPPGDESSVYDSIYKNARALPGYSRYAYYADVIKRKRYPLRFLADSEECFYAVNLALQMYPGNSPRILEVGSGLGYLTYALWKEGYDCVGCDISAEAVQRAKDRFHCQYLHLDIERNRLEEKYDLIILTEVIEHLAEPLRMIGALQQCLRKRGQIVLTTPRKPQINSLSYWDTELPPVHWTWITANGVNKLANRAGAQAALLDTTGFYYGRRRPEAGTSYGGSSICPRTPILASDGTPLQFATKRNQLRDRIDHFLDNTNLKRAVRTAYAAFQRPMTDPETTSILAATLSWENR
jgi:SAM-dependent methyltransferase